jgi:hypothetical protein
MEEELSKKIDEITSEIASLGDTLSAFEMTSTTLQKSDTNNSRTQRNLLPKLIQWYPNLQK